MYQYREELCYWYFKANKRNGFFLNVSELLAILSYHLNSKGNWSPLCWNCLMVCGYFKDVFCSLLITDTHRRVTDMAGSQMEHPTHLSVLTIIRSIYWHQSEGCQQTEQTHKEGRSVVGSELVTLEEVVEDRVLGKLLAIMDHASLPLHKTLDKLKSSFSNRLIQTAAWRNGTGNPSYQVPSDFITVTPSLIIFHFKYLIM